MDQIPSTIQLREVIVWFADVYLWISNLLFIIHFLIFQSLSFSSLCLGWFQPPSTLRPLEMTEHDAVIIIATKLLLRSYYDIVRKNIQDLVPKAIMHFLVRPLPSLVLVFLFCFIFGLFPWSFLFDTLSSPFKCLCCC